MMYSADETYSDEITSPTERPAPRGAYTVYAAHASGVELTVGSYWTQDAAETAIRNYLVRHPSATCYINNGTVGYVSEARR